MLRGKSFAKLTQHNKLQFTLNNIHTFSQASAEYARHRPSYPRELFVYLTNLAENKDLAWDCATGNGQAAVALTEFFARVEATDLSAAQIENHLPHERVRFSVSPAEQTSFADNSFDLITVAQAWHWFDQPKFKREVLRVLKPNGVFAAWGYGLFSIAPEIDSIIESDLYPALDSLWADGNRILLDGYRALTLPVDEIDEPPTFEIKLEWTLSQVLDYLRTWSALKRHIAELGSDPLSALEVRIKSVWGNPLRARPVRMPIVLRIGKII